MASISKRRDQRWFVRFTNPAGKRKTITLGAETEQEAINSKWKIESLLNAKANRKAIPAETETWLAHTASPELRAKLREYGLIDEPAPAAGQQAQVPTPPEASLTLGVFLGEYFARRTDVKASTRIGWGHVRRNLIDFFEWDKPKPLQAITAGDAKDFERFLKTQAKTVRKGAETVTMGLAPTTVGKRIQVAKEFFTDALDRELIDKDPFAKLESGNRSNRTRDFFVTLQMADQVLVACPDDEWRAIFAFARFGGLRCPSEILGLKWSDVDWERQRITVRSPKTEHHEGKEFRVIPMFPELKQVLERLFGPATEANKGRPLGHVVTRYRRDNANLRSQLLRIIGRAGLSPWPKLFQNLRSSRDTELKHHFPAHVVNAWIGHTEKVARKFYEQVTDDDFLRAVRPVESEPRSTCAPLERDSTRSDALSCETARRKPHQIAPNCLKVAEEGFEPPTRGL